MEILIGRLRTTILDAPEKSDISQHHKIHFENLCKEPADLNWRLFRWFTETSELEILEINDEDWNPPVPESSFCSIEPVTGINSTTMQRSLCPWQWKLNHDENREPKIISEAHCLCRRSRGSSGSFCMPIKRQIAVLKRTRCDPTTGYYKYTRALQTVTVGCHSVLPRSQKASPLTNLYRKTSIVEI
ncbi:unnamed protein product [Cercopithifilaria johnstoni]|uniref:Interleukin-17A n=1 Tax=Cercopithifilaria johnstoni TaxID=2874296 RepID=A0A8J2PQG2_9BILA|nr:unnamed protein product [Cercopithifilaria johnstoni]